MKLLPKELEQTLPKLYSTKNIPANEKVLKIKFFTPDANWSWYVSEYDKDEKIFFGFVDGNYPEWGYFSLYELESIISENIHQKMIASMLFCLHFKMH